MFSERFDEWQKIMRNQSSSEYLASCVHVSGVHPVENDASVSGGDLWDGDSLGSELVGRLQAELDHLLWHRIDTRSSSKLRRKRFILVLLVIWNTCLIVYKNFAKSNIGTSIVPRTMPGLDFPMLVVLIVLKSILCKSSDFVTRRTKSGQLDWAADLHLDRPFWDVVTLDLCVHYYCPDWF